MTDARDIHQIEYRWHYTRDFSPVASSMSQQSTRGWDSRIRGWVRHPNVDQPSESVCYQILPNEAAALAWRYRDRQAAELEDGTRGRPLVSRVLVGHASVLTPEVAIALCRTGLPNAAGERPGRVAAGNELPPIGADQLAAVVHHCAARLDEDAAAEQGLSQAVAAALSDPNTPLAISIGNPLIFQPPDNGPQALLLWGLWRITGPLLGTMRRGWSFSTFELPLGDVDPRTLPDILFRLAQSGQAAAPAKPRREIKVHPGGPSTLPTDFPYATLAEWLTAEYEKTGGSGLGQLIAKCSQEQSLHARMAVAYEMLSAKWSALLLPSAAAHASPAPAADPQAPGRPGREPVEVPRAAAAEVAQAGVPEADAHPAGETYQAEEARQAVPRPQKPDIPDPGETAAGSPGPARWAQEGTPVGMSTREGSTAPPLPLPDRGHQSPGRQDPEPQPASRLYNDSIEAADLSVLLELLTTARDLEEITSLVSRILAPETCSDGPGRRKARFLIGNNNFFIPVFAKYQYQLPVAYLADIFSKVVIPDLDRKTVRTEVTEWAYRGEHSVVSALIAAARSFGGDIWDEMRGILQPVLALRWLEEHDLADGWELAPVQAAAPPAREPGKGFFDRFKRG